MSVSTAAGKATGAPTATRAGWPARVAVWALLVVLVSMAAGIHDHAQHSADRLAASVTAASSTEPSAATASGAAAPAALAPGAALGTGPGVSADPAMPKAVCDPDQCQNPLRFLPAWRWGDAPLTARKEGVLDFMKFFPVEVGSLCFAFSGLVWYVLLQVMRAGFTSDVVHLAAKPINLTAAALAGDLLYVLVIGMVVIAVGFIAAFIRGKMVRAVRKAAVFALAFGAIIATLSASASATASGNDFAAGSLPWVAQTVDQDLQAITSSFGSGFGITDAVESFATPSTAAQSGPPAPSGGSGSASTSELPQNCTAYLDALHAEFNYAQSASPSKDAPTSLAMSKLWEASFYRPWQTAEFGRPGAYDLPNAASCHFMEQVNHIPAGQQLATAQVAYPGLFDATSPAAVKGVFAPVQDADDQRRKTNPWAMCTFNGTQFRISAPFDAATKGNADRHNDIDNGCQQHFADGFVSDPGHVANVGKKDPLILDGKELNDSLQWDGVDPSSADYQAVYAYGSAFLGDNTSDELVQGLMSIVVALAFLFAFGALAGGVLMAQLLLVLMLILLPVTLAALGMGSPHGKRMLKLTGTSVATHSMFALMMTFVVDVTELIEYLVTQMFGQSTFGTGYMASVLYAIAPLVALRVLRKMTTAIGMGDMGKLSTTGAFFTAAALRATGDREFAKTANKVEAKNRAVINKAGRMVGQRNLADKLDKRSSYGHVLAGGRWVGKGAITRSGAPAVARAAKDKLIMTGEKLFGAASDDKKAGVLRQAASVAMNKMPDSSVAKWAGTAAKVAASPAGVNGMLGLLGGTVATGGLGLVAAGALFAARQVANKKKAQQAAAEAGMDTPVYAKDAAGAAKTARKQQRVRMRALDGIGDNNERKLMRTAAIGTFLSNTATARFPVGFTGFNTHDELALGLAGFANRTKIDGANLIASTTGLITLNPNVVIRAGRRDFSKVNVETLRAPEAWLDPATVESITNTFHTEGERAAAVVQVLRERNAITDEGLRVDFLAANGYDIDDAAVRAHVEAWMQDKVQDAKLDTLVLQAPTDTSGEWRMVIRAANWERNEATAPVSADLLLGLDAIVAEAASKAQAVVPAIGGGVADGALFAQLNKVTGDYLTAMRSAAQAQADAQREVLEEQARELRRALVAEMEGVGNVLGEAAADAAVAVADANRAAASNAGEFVAGFRDSVERIVRRDEEWKSQVEHLKASMYGADSPAAVEKVLAALDAKAAATRDEIATALAEAARVAEQAKAQRELVDASAERVNIPKIASVRDLLPADLFPAR